MNAKHHEKIAERCRENGALYVDEFDYPKVRSANPPIYPILTKPQIEGIRRFNEEAQRLARARLGSERVAVIKLDEKRHPNTDEDWYVPTLSQAIERWKFRDYELLHINDWYGGILVRDDYLLVSELHLRRIGISEALMQ